MWFALALRTQQTLYACLSWRMWIWTGSTRPCVSVGCSFLPNPAYCAPRDDSHKLKFPEYPSPTHYLHHAGKYFFRHADLRHLRIEQVAHPLAERCVAKWAGTSWGADLLQVVRYYSSSAENTRAEETLEDTIPTGDYDPDSDTSHRHHDHACERILPGAKLASTRVGLVLLTRRPQTRLACSRTPFMDTWRQYYGSV